MKAAPKRTMGFCLLACKKLRTGNLWIVSKMSVFEFEPNFKNKRREFLESPISERALSPHFLQAPGKYRRLKNPSRSSFVLKFE
jgi:hypothetical protein